MKRTARLSACLFAAALLLHPAARAQSIWDGGSSTTANWSNRTNWFGDVALGNPTTNIVYLSGTVRTNPVVDTPWTIQTLVVTNAAGQFTLQGTNLTITANANAAGFPYVFQHNGGNAFVANTPIVLPATTSNPRRQFYVSGAGSATFNGDITATGTGRADVFIRGNGPGQGRINGRILIGTNTLQRADNAIWTIASNSNVWETTSMGGTGTLRIAINDALPTNTFLQFSDTPRLDLSNFNQTVVGLTATGVIRTGLGAGGRFTVADNGATNTFFGQIVENGSLLKRGPGTLNLQGANTFIGGVSVAEGILRVGTGGKLQNSAANSIVISNGAMLVLSNVNAISANHTTAVLNPITVQQGGTLKGDREMRLGNIALNGGTILLDGGSLLYGTFMIPDTITVGGTSVSIITNTAAANSELRPDTATVFSVGEVTAGDDLVVYAPLLNRINNNGPANFTKSGAGSMQLESTGNTLSGVVTVAAGRLGIGAASSLPASTITVASAATLDVSALGDYAVTNQTITGVGTVLGSLAPGLGGALLAGGIGTPGTLTITGQVVVAGAAYTNTFDLTNDVTAGSGVNDLLSIGAVFEPSTSVVRINPLAIPTGGVYRLIDYVGTMGTAFDPVVQGNTFRQTWTLDTATPGQVNLNVSDVTNVLLVWSGDISGDWDTATFNWTNLNTGLADRFYEGDAVLFDDTGADSNEVTLLAQMRPAAVTVDSASNYVFLGAGRISNPPGVAATLTKAGTGTLVVHTTNDYTGGTIVSGGVLQVGDGGPSGALGPSGIRIAAPGTLAYRRPDGSYTNASALSGDGTLLLLGTGVSTQGQYTFTGVNTGFTGTIIVSNGARIQLDSANDAGNAALIQVKDGGGLFLNAGTFGRPVEIAGLGWTENAGRLGAMRIDTGNWTGSVTLTDNARISSFSVNGTVSGPISGPYELELWAGATARSTTLTPPTPNAYGSLRMSSNAIAVAGNTNAYSQGPVVMNGGTLRLNGFNFAFSNLTSTVYGGTIVNNHASTPSTFTIGLDGSSTPYGGVFANGNAGILNVTKVGAGTLTLDGANLNSGAFTIQNGTLALGTAGSLASSSSVVLAGGAFNTLAKGVYTPAHPVRGSGTLVGSQYYVAGTVVQPGGPAVAGTIAVTGNLLMASAYTNSLDLSTDPLAVGGGTNDLFAVTGDLEPGNSALAINMLNPPLAVGTYTLMTYTGGKTTFFNTNVLGNTSRRVWTLDEATPNAINLIVSGDAARSLQWLPVDSAVWDLGATNWLDTVGLVADRFYDGDTVLFDDAGLYSNAVVLTGALVPAAITVNSTGEYSLAGSGRIGGATGLTKLGPGLLTISNGNDFTGAAYISNGVVRVAHSNALGSGAGATFVNGGAIDLNGTSLTNVGERFVISGTGFNGTGTIFNAGADQLYAIRYLTLASDASIANWLPAGRWDVRGGGGSTFNGEVNLSGFTLRKIGPGRVSFVDSTITNAGDFIVDAGMVEFSRGRVGGPGGVAMAPGTVLYMESYSSGYFAKPIGLDGATLTNSGNALTIGGTVTLTNANVIGSSATLTFTNTIAGPGGFAKLGNGYVVLANSNSFAGPVTVNNNGGGPLSLASPNGPAMPVNVQIGHTNNGGGTAFLYASNNLQFATGVTLNFGGSPNDWAWMKLFGTTQYVAAIVSDDNGGGVFDNVYQENGYNSDAQFVLTGPGDSYWSGSYLRDNGGGTSLGKLRIVQAGPGTATFAGGRANTIFTGGMTVSNGVLNLKSHYAAGRGTIALAGGTLALDGAGLKEDIVGTSTFSASTSNSLSTAVKLSPVRANTQPDMATDTMYLYTGFIVNTAAVPVTWTFAEQFDDTGYLKIDDTVVLNNGAPATPTHGTITLAPGLHRFDLRAHNGATYGGAKVGAWWTNDSYAFGIDFQGRATANQDYFVRLEDAGDGLLLLTDVQITNPVVLAADATIRVSSVWGPTNSVNGPVSGGYGLTKTGRGALLLGNSNTYNGATTVTDGRLLVNGVLALTPTVSVVSNASLGGTGTLSVASVTVAGGGAIGRFDGASTGALTVANLALDAGARIVALATGLEPAVRVTGAFSTSASNAVRILPEIPLVLGTNVVVDYTGSISGAGPAGLVLLPLPNGAQGYLQDNGLDTTVELVVTNLGIGIQWYGGVDEAWDVLGTANWKSRLDGTPTVFNAYDAVLFDDTAAGNFAVDLAGLLTPGGIVVSNETQGYSFADGVLSGAGGLLKQGAALLAITNAALDYTGATVVAGGSLKLENLPRFAGSLLNQSTVELASASGDWQLGTSRSMSGDGVFRKTGPGVVTLFNTSVAASNLIAVEEGMLRNAGNASVWTANQADLDIAAGATFDVRADAVRFDALTGNGTVTNSYGNAAPDTMTLGVNDGSGAFAGTIQDGGVVVAGENNGSITLLKTGSGTQSLATVNIAGGITLDGGTLAFTADSAARGLLFGVSGTSTNVSVLDLSTASLVVPGLTAQVSTSTPNFILIGAGRTLTVNGAVSVGNNSGTNRFTSLTVLGAGSLLVTGPTYQVGAATGGANFDTVTNDLANLATFVADLGTGGVFRVGNIASSSPTVSGVPTTMLLASNSLIVANVIGIGDATGQGTLMGSLLLGAQSNVVYANRINIGLANTQRSSGRMLFAGASGNLTVRGVSGGSSRANVNVLSHNSGTGTFTTGLLDLTDHPADLLIDTLTIDSRLATNSTGNSGTMHFNNGVLDATSILIGRRASTGGTGTGTLNIGGGSVIVGTGGVAIAHSLTAGGTSVGLLNLTGGDVTVSGRIYRVGGMGTANATLNLDGATLDMLGNAIGGPAATNAISNLLLASGTLANVGELNNGAPWAKTTTGTLTIAGANGFTGPGFVSNGTLLVNGTLGTGGVTTVAGTTLGGTGVIGGPVTAEGLVSPGASAGILTIGGDYVLTASTATQLVEIGGTTPGSGHDQIVVSNSAAVTASLEVQLIGGHTPVAGNTYTILVAAAVGGPFGTVSLPALGPNLGWEVQYPGAAVVLAVTSGVPPLTGYDLAATVIDNGLSGYNDDADGDGFANLLEYVTGGSLTNPGTQARMNGGRTNNVLALKFSRDTNVVDATIYVEGSYTATNNADWVGIATNLAGSWGGSSTNVTESVGSPASVTVQDTISTATNRFLRLRVTRP